MGNVQTAARHTRRCGARHRVVSWSTLAGRTARRWGNCVCKDSKRFSSRREGILLGLLVLALHGAVIYWVSQKPTPVLPIVPPEIPPMTIEFSQPAPPLVEPPPPAPPPVVEPPPPPVVDELPPPAPPKPVPKPKPAPKPAPKPVPKAVEPPPVPTPPKPAPAAAPVPVAPAPVTPASANAAYLKTRRRNTRHWLSVAVGKARCCCACRCWPAVNRVRSRCKKQRSPAVG